MTAYWYLTRGTGVVTLVLLTLSVCLGIAITKTWRLPGLPRFVTAGLHRNVTLLSVVFLAVHVVTTLLDTYTSIGVTAVFIPFVSSYRPIWLGLGALSSDLVLALVVTSLLRRHLGYRRWRAIHWAAYVSWPVALLHSLGTGSDARTAWMALLTAACVAAVVVVVIARVADSRHAARRPAVAAALAAAALGLVLWYANGPSQHGWASRAGTPTRLLASVRTASRHAVTTRARFVSVPGSFAGDLRGTAKETAADGGTVVVHIDTTLLGPLRGRLRLALQGYPTEGGGVSMTASGATFRATGTDLYQGSIVSLDGTRVGVHLASSTQRVSLTLDLHLARNGVVTGSYQGQA